VDDHDVQVALNFAQPLGCSIDYDNIAILLAQPAGKFESQFACADDDDSRIVSLQTADAWPAHGAIRCLSEPYLTSGIAYPASMRRKGPARAGPTLVRPELGRPAPGLLAPGRLALSLFQGEEKLCLCCQGSVGQAGGGVSAAEAMPGLQYPGLDG
jgi:hypothetical protein